MVIDSEEGGLEGWVEDLMFSVYSLYSLNMYIYVCFQTLNKE